MIFKDSEQEQRNKPAWAAFVAYSESRDNPFGEARDDWFAWWELFIAGWNAAEEFIE